HLQVTIVDSLNKRIQFLNHLILQLGLEGVECLHARAEDAARLPKYRDKFDMVTARAVAKLNVLNELCLPFVVKGGCFIAMKGNDPEDEVKGASFSARELKSRINKIHSFELPIEQSSRHIIVIDKLQSTPVKYPRKAGLPLKSPLI
ncbi:MAG TPA: 16S rRNA (guanine(527)-N(7))-methyltransferase RsmG, partial [Bacilli bacterium]